mmetsp:Transcript_53272/g.141653  ORF Transcript_53272/g.141653 Transcript_53272/m.141653 type:complete len:218 (-) Transcript_53272:123-776(-)
MLNNTRQTNMEKEQNQSNDSKYPGPFSIRGELSKSPTIIRQHEFTAREMSAKSSKCLPNKLMPLTAKVTKQVTKTTMKWATSVDAAYNVFVTKDSRGWAAKDLKCLMEITNGNKTTQWRIPTAYRPEETIRSSARLYNSSRCAKPSSPNANVPTRAELSRGLSASRSRTCRQLSRCSTQAAITRPAPITDAQSTTFQISKYTKRSSSAPASLSRLRL